MSLDILCASEFSSRYQIPEDVRSLLLPINDVHVVSKGLFMSVKEGRKRWAEEVMEYQVKRVCDLKPYSLEALEALQNSSIGSESLRQAKSLTTDLISHEILDSEEDVSSIICMSSQLHEICSTQDNHLVSAGEILQSTDPLRVDILSSYADEQQRSSPPCIDI